MFDKLFLVLASAASLAVAAPYPHDSIPLNSDLTNILQARDADPNACPGYAASNVVKTDSSLTADLTLAGEACNVYSDDIKDLKLVVEYQTSRCSPTVTATLRLLGTSCENFKLIVYRRAPSRKDLRCWP